MYVVGIIVVLAVFLVCAGGLFLLISRRLPQSQGLEAIALGGALMGLGFGLQLTFPSRELNPALLINHTATATAVLCFLEGVRRFVGWPPLRWHGLLGFVLAFTLAQPLVELAFGAQGRYIMLASCSAVIYGALTYTLVRGALGQALDMRVGMGLMAVSALGVGVLNAVKAYLLATQGIAMLDVETPFQKVFYTLIAVTVAIMAPAVLWLIFTRLSNQLSAQASTDALTGVLNRSGLRDCLQRHWRDRPSAELTLMMLDVDHFKAINDAYGHLAGDAVLHAIARTLQASVRGGDWVARTGGEEFMVVVPGMRDSLALALARRLGAAVAQVSVPVAGVPQGLQCSVSIGVSHPMRSLADFDRAVGEADQALYIGKQLGRNRVIGADGRESRAGETGAATLH